MSCEIATRFGLRRDTQMMRRPMRLEIVRSSEEAIARGGLFAWPACFWPHADGRVHLSADWPHGRLKRPSPGAGISARERKVAMHLSVLRRIALCDFGGARAGSPLGPLLCPSIGGRGNKSRFRACLDRRHSPNQPAQLAHRKG